MQSREGQFDSSVTQP
nr:unnamed protein product [Callosobruchus chinensis]CAH7730705.1 unnamed protein product [Callosobruchus chinensis]CAH7730781.1 unnamed protein product [Callosobruchus chinensis]CAH7733685.1 unnamed protein product [Callosobruchus chinensis]CAH7741792.1 unnamed protein product [Callosobruchus chinensis]